MKDFEIRCNESRLEKNNTLYGKFTLGPFLPGQGTTFGNAVRRSLLSELSGLAITAFEILSVMHEFSTLPGLRESVMDLSLNLKQVVLTGVLPYSTPPIGFLKVRGPAIVKAADLKLPPGVCCTSPNQYIATLSSNGSLNLKFLISVGKGYSTQPSSFYRSLSKMKVQGNREWDEKKDYLSAKDPNVDNIGIFNNLAPSNGKVLASKSNNELLQTTKSKLKNSKANPIQTPLQAHKNKLAESAASYLQANESKGITRNTNRTRGENESNTFRLIPRLSDEPGYRDQSYRKLYNFDDVLSLNTHIQTQAFQRIKPHQVLPIDPHFTPVFRVNFLIQANDRFEIPREDIVLEVWTNGSIHPKRALEEATLSLVQSFDRLLKKIQQSSSFYKGLHYLSSLQNESSSIPLADVDVQLAYSRNYKLHKAIYNLDVGNLNLSLETFLLLKQANITTLEQLLTHFSPEEKKIRKVSKKAIVIAQGSIPSATRNGLLASHLHANEKIVNELKQVITKLANS